MKKLAAMVLTLSLTMVPCGMALASESEAETEAVTEAAAEEAVTEAPEEKSEGVMTYAEYDAAELDTEVTVETYIQAKQSWWEEDGQGKATFYTQDHSGAYFLYDMPCTQEEYDKLLPGTKIKVTGYKSEWSGEVEIVDISAFEIEEGEYLAEAKDMTEVLGTEDLQKYQNQFVTFKGMTVETSTYEYEEDGEKKTGEADVLYRYDNSGQDGDDLYFTVSLDGNSYTFTVESYLCDNTTDVYKAVKELHAGDVIDLEGFLYWYEGPNPHITAVKAAE